VGRPPVSLPVVSLHFEVPCCRRKAMAKRKLKREKNAYDDS
jgi:hypothetical protein